MNKKATVKLLGIAVFIIAALAICGVIFDMEILRTWGRQFPMPLNVSICLAAIGAALYIIGNNE